MIEKYKSSHLEDSGFIPREAGVVHTGGSLLGSHQLCSWPKKSLHHEDQTGLESAAAVSGGWEGTTHRADTKLTVSKPGKRTGRKYKAL